MDQLELSIIADPEHAASLKRLGAQCQILVMSWDTAWAEVMKAALYKDGPDISQIGAPWTSNFAAMNALRPFSRREITTMGGPSAFLPAAWQTTLETVGGQGWSIPWLADVRIIYYWRDLLEKAGVDEQTAFRTPAHVEDTLGRLQAKGLESTWIVMTQLPFSTLQNVASWIWGAGGDFVSADGKRTLFTQPEALTGLRAFFNLRRYLPPNIQQLEVAQTVSLFTERRAAAAMGTPDWLNTIRNQERETPGILDRLGIALPPGPHYVGGSNLAIWGYTRREREAVELARHLTSKQVQREFCLQIGYLPVRIDALAEPPYATDPFFQVMGEALRAGRTYPTLPMWGLVEERLSNALIQIWAAVIANPDQGVDAVIIQRLEPLSRRLELTLSESD
jgi:multiple sugar transport system substrate-binding protein